MLKATTILIVFHLTPLVRARNIKHDGSTYHHRRGGRISKKIPLGFPMTRLRESTSTAETYHQGNQATWLPSKPCLVMDPALYILLKPNVFVLPISPSGAAIYPQFATPVQMKMIDNVFARDKNYNLSLMNINRACFCMLDKTASNRYTVLNTLNLTGWNLLMSIHVIGHNSGEIFIPAKWRNLLKASCWSKQWQKLVTQSYSHINRLMATRSEYVYMPRSMGNSYVEYPPPHRLKS